MSTVLVHLANISYRLGRTLEFDAQNLSCKGDPEATAHVHAPVSRAVCRARKGVAGREKSLSYPMGGDPLAYLTAQLDAWRKAGTYQRLRVLESASAAESRFDGHEVINLASNNYLGLTTHPKLVEAALEATRKFGVGSGAVRTISGTMSIHMELEQRIARFKNVEACVVFQSGFAANAGTVSAILGPEDHIISDELNHASIIDGCRLSKAKIHVFPHKDVAAAERILQELASVSDTSC